LGQQALLKRYGSQLRSTAVHGPRLEADGVLPDVALQQELVGGEHGACLCSFWPTFFIFLFKTSFDRSLANNRSGFAGGGALLKARRERVDSAFVWTLV
jgi:hypothetical protein